MFHSAFDDWIIGLFGILGMALFIGCTSCWHHKSSHPGGRRQPPPPPTPDLQPRYEHGPYPPNPAPAAAADHSVLQKTSANDGDSEEDFEEFLSVNATQQAEGKGQKSVEDRGAQQDTYVNLDAAQDYENLPDLAVKEDHVYLKILESNPETDATAADNKTGADKTPRSAINSIGKYSSHSDSLCHSYENVAMEGPTVSLESDLDYVNVSPSL
ncbi:uncharacterized protein [Ranitomeya imitator]|uniref:uncharacterized protein n=1 Tax=Ranitomeya imitator TaxID=111125 RepID=UPI0037E8C9BC